MTPLTCFLAALIVVVWFAVLFTAVDLAMDADNYRRLGKWPARILSMLLFALCLAVLIYAVSDHKPKAPPTAEQPL